MSRKIKIFALILSLALCLTMAAVPTVFATPDDESYDTTPVESDTYVEPSEDTTPVETDPIPTETQPKTQAPETYTNETQAPTTAATTSYYEDDDNDYDNNDYTNSYEERESNTSNEKAETAAVYDAEDDDVSTDTLKKGDWAKIAAQLKNANGDSADDFAFIRNNDAGGSNNGEWMLILGIALEVLGLGIVVFLIVMKIRSNKAVKAGNFGGSAGATRAAPRGAQHAQPRGSKPQAAERRSSQSSKRSSKFDTADVVVPRHAQGRRGRK